MVRKGTQPDEREVLEIKGLTGRDYMTINHRRYLIAPMDSYGLRKRAELKEITRRIDELERAAAVAVRAKQDLNAVDEAEYDQRIRELVQYALPTISQKVVAEMTQGECQQVTGHFFVWLAKTQTGLFEALRWVIASSSPGSARPTGAASG